MSYRGRIEFSYLVSLDRISDEDVVDVDFEVFCDIHTCFDGDGNTEVEASNFEIWEHARRLTDDEVAAFLEEHDLQEPACETFCARMRRGPGPGTRFRDAATGRVVEVVGTGDHVGCANRFVIYREVGVRYRRGFADENLLLTSCVDWDEARLDDDSRRFRPILPEPLPGEFRMEGAEYVKLGSKHLSAQQRKTEQQRRAKLAKVSDEPMWPT